MSNNTLTVLATSLALAVIIILAGVASHLNNIALCQEHMARMEAFVKCVDSEGCFYDADMMFEARKSYYYNTENCPNG